VKAAEFKNYYTPSGARIVGLGIILSYLVILKELIDSAPTSSSSWSGYPAAEAL